MKVFEILRLIESKSLPTRSYRVPEKLMMALRDAGKKIFGGDAEDSKLLFYFAAYGVKKWMEDQAQSLQKRRVAPLDDPRQSGGHEGESGSEKWKAG